MSTHAARTFSVIIPTLWRDPPTTLALLENLQAQDAVREIILINNAREHLAGEKSKLRVISPPRNLFVNPAWNLGASLAQCKYLAILNDDIQITRNCFEKLAEFPIEEWGVLGASLTVVNTTWEATRHRDAGSWQPIEWKETMGDLECIPHAKMPLGFGVFMTMHQSHYRRIPHCLRIWSGDAYLFYRNLTEGRANGALTIPLQTHMNTTSGAAEFEFIKHLDLRWYRARYRTEWRIRRAWKNIFCKLERSDEVQPGGQASTRPPKT